MTLNYCEYDYDATSLRGVFFKFTLHELFGYVISSWLRLNLSNSLEKNRIKRLRYYFVTTEKCFINLCKFICIFFHEKFKRKKIKYKESYLFLNHFQKISFEKFRIGNVLILYKKWSESTFCLGVTVNRYK